jgi:hypothetical protein
MEATAINETQFSTIRGEQRILRLCVIRFGDPLLVENRKDIGAQHSNRVHADSMLNQSSRLHDDVVGHEQRLIRLEESAPRFLGGSMIVVVAIDDGVQGGGIYEDHRDSKASASASSCRLDVSCTPDANRPAA